MTYDYKIKCTQYIKYIREYIYIIDYGGNGEHINSFYFKSDIKKTVGF